MNPNQNNNRGNGGNKRNVTAIVSVLLWALVLTLLVNVATSRFQQANSVEVLYGQFRDLVMDGVVDSVLMESDRYTFTLKEGTLYPILHTLERDGAVKSYEKEAPTGRTRKYYHVTKKGLRLLDEKKEEWTEFSKTVNAILAGTAPALA